MPRRDQYRPHDDNAAAAADRRRKGSDYGNHAERSARTSADGQAQFQGRDYERESYGGGYGNQRHSRDVPAAGRKGEWMHSGGGEHHQMSATDDDAAYRRWRDAELSRHDEDYRAWRRAQQERHDQDYAAWKAAGSRPKRRP